MNHLVQIGLMGAIGCFRSADLNPYPRDARVVCRTSRGLEVGTVLCTTDGSDESECDGQLLRMLGREDRMIVERLDRFRDRAFKACAEKLRSLNVSAALVDVEHLFDGQSVYFYFLGDLSDPRLDRLMEELGETYEQKVKFQKFAQTLAEGCGPGCGTSASKCGTSGGCASCALGCRTKS